MMKCLVVINIVYTIVCDVICVYMYVCLRACNYHNYMIIIQYLLYIIAFFVNIQQKESIKAYKLTIFVFDSQQSHQIN